MIDTFALGRWLRRVFVPALAAYSIVGFVAGSLDAADWTWWARLAALVLFLILVPSQKDKP